MEAKKKRNSHPRTYAEVNVLVAENFLYFKKYLSRPDIKKLFGKTEDYFINKKVREAKKVMAEQHLGTIENHTVNREAAYIAWGIDPADIERRASKIRKLGLEEIK